MICIRDETGVARPIWNKVTPARRLVRNATGILTTIPWVMTKSVRPLPLKKPTKQKRNDVRMQSMA